LLAMGVPTTSDDTGYFLWFAHHWTMCVVPAFAMGALLIFWVARAIRTWTARPPSSSDPPGTQTQALELHEQSNQPGGSSQTDIPGPIELQARAYLRFSSGFYSRA
jgi:hypothetical protein